MLGFFYFHVISRNVPVRMTSLLTLHFTVRDIQEAGKKQKQHTGFKPMTFQRQTKAATFFVQSSNVSMQLIKDWYRFEAIVNNIFFFCIICLNSRQLTLKSAASNKPNIEGLLEPAQ